MNLYEFEGKEIFAKFGIKIPRGFVVHRNVKLRDGAIEMMYNQLGAKDVVVKAQVLSGKRGKNNGIRFCSSADEVERIIAELFQLDIRGQYVAAVRVEEKLDIVEEHYLSITYDTNKKQPVLVYSAQGGMDIEDVPEEKILKVPLDIRNQSLSLSEISVGDGKGVATVSQNLWKCFLKEDTRVAEINPLVKTAQGEWLAADAKVAIDDDAFYRHGSTGTSAVSSVPDGSPQVTDWTQLEPRTMLGRLPTEREIAAKKIDEGEAYYRGTAGKYIEMDGDVALILNGGGASIANMDAIINLGLKPANYTEYSGNPPREKVHALAKVVLSKPGIRALWMCGVVANFTNVKETFLGIIDVLDELKPKYPIVVRRDGPESAEAFRLLQECAQRNGLNMKMFNKDMSMSDSAQVLFQMLSEK